MEKAIVNKRIDWIDCAKAIGILCIVIDHSLAQCKLKLYLLSLFSFIVPLFFVLSGMVFSTKKYNDFKGFLITQVKRIMVPYFIFGLFSLLIFFLLGNFASERLGMSISQKEYWWYLLGLLYGDASNGLLIENQPLWFLPCLFITKIIFYFIDKMINKKKKYLIVFFAAFLLSAINMSWLKLTALPFGAQTALNMSSFFTLGLLIKEYNTKKSIKIHDYKDLLFGIIFLVTGCSGGFLNVQIDYITSYYGNAILFLVSGYFGSIGWLLNCRFIGSIKNLNLIGKETLPILLMHKFPVMFFKTVVPFTAVLLKSSSALASITVSLLSIIICLIAAEILRRIAPFMIGEKRLYHKG